MGFFGKKLVHKCNKRGVEGGINLKGKSTNVEGGNCVWRMDFFSKSTLSARILSVSIQPPRGGPHSITLGINMNSKNYKAWNFVSLILINLAEKEDFFIVSDYPNFRDSLPWKGCRGQ